MAHEVIVPKTGIYTGDVHLLEWLVGEGEWVEEGAALFRMETEKVEQDIEAERAGFLHRTGDIGTDYAIGTVIGALAATKEEYESLVGKETR